MDPFLPLLFGFAIGSIPTTYLLVKWRKRMDIRDKGTGNVGAMNAFEVTGSAWIGVAAMAVDALKGAAAVVFAELLFGVGAWTIGAAAVGAILGHNFSPWLGFKGGRGLATALGVSIVAGWIIGAIWLVLFGLVFLLRRDIHTGNILASLLLPGVVSVLPTPLVDALVPGLSHTEVAWISLCLAVLLLLGHWNVIIQFFKPSPRPQ